MRAIDTGTVSAGLALLALGSRPGSTQGTTDEEVDSLVERFQSESRIIFTVDTLEFLAKGGRIGKAAAMAGTLLNIKPILAIERGEVVPVKRVRGAHKAFLEFVDAFDQGSVDRPSLRVGIAHADAPDRLEALRELVRRTRPEAQVDLETTLGAVVGTHAGPGRSACSGSTTPARSSAKIRALPRCPPRQGGGPSGRGSRIVTTKTPAQGRLTTVPSRRELLALSALLAATLLTAGIAIAGLTRNPSAPPARIPTVDQIVNQPAPGHGRPRRVEPGD